MKIDGMLLCLNLLFFLFLFLMVLILWRESVRTMHQIMERSKDSAGKRQEEAELKMREEGNREKVGWLYRVDLVLQQSGLVEKFPFLNTELYLLTAVTGAAVSFAITERVTGRILFGAAAGIVTGLLFYSFVSFLCSRNYHRMESSLIKFTNLLESYSQTEDDIIAIMGKVYPYLSEPLREIVRSCYAEASTDGDVEAAFSRMKRRIPHRKLRELLDNLETCSLHQANYPDVISKNRNVIRVSLAEKEKRKQTVRSERVNIVAILGCGVICIKMIDSIIGGGLKGTLTGEGLGQCLLFALFAVVVYAVYNMITMGDVRE